MRTALLLVVAALAAPTVTACKHDRAAPPLVAQDDAGTLLHRRIWLDHEPKSERDRFQLLVFTDRDFGVYQDRTIWKGAFEAFKFEAREGRLVLKLPASGKVVKTGFRIERVRRGHADVRLTIDQPHEGPNQYWGYPIDDHAVDADAWLNAEFPSLAD